MGGFWIWVATFLGGGLGAMARHAVSWLAAVHLSQTFPIGTLIANVTGSFLIGLADVLFIEGGRFYAPPELRQFFMIGVLGGYTTFSSFSLQTLNLVRDREWLAAGLNVGGSVALCLLGVYLGYILGEWLTQLR